MTSEFRKIKVNDLRCNLRPTTNPPSKNSRKSLAVFNHRDKLEAMPMSNVRAVRKELQNAGTLAR